MKSQPLTDRHTIADLWSDLYRRFIPVAKIMNSWMADCGTFEIRSSSR
jgi:hypothetical protein